MRITGVHTAVVEANYDWTYVRVDAEGEGLSAAWASASARPG